MNKFTVTICGLILLLLLSSCRQTQESTPRPGQVNPTTISNTIPPTLTLSEEKMAVIYDDDGSPDGTVALFYLLSHPQVDMQAVNISYGESYPAVYIQHIGRMLDHFELTGIPLGYGQDHPLEGENSFPEGVRESSGNFWGIGLPNESKTYPVQPAPELIVSVLNQSSKPVTIFVSGPLTNLALALRLDPAIRQKIAAVHIMGGAVNVPGNISDFYPDSTNKVAEWNIYADPQAASEVFESNLELFLVPLDATNQVVVTSKDIKRWDEGGVVADYAAEFYRMMINDWGMKEAQIWDLMTSVIMLNPELCKFQSLSLEVVTQPGDTNGQTAIIPHGEPNVSVCLEPDAEAIRQTIGDIFSTANIDL